MAVTVATIVLKPEKSRTTTRKEKEKKPNHRENHDKKHWEKKPKSVQVHNQTEKDGGGYLDEGPTRTCQFS